MPKGCTVVVGRCAQEVVHTEDADLNTLPIIQCWPEDGGKVHQRWASRYQHSETGWCKIWASIAYRFLGRRRRRHTCIRIMMGHGNFRAWASGGSRVRWPLRWAASPRCLMRPPRRCRRGLTSTCSRGFCRGGVWSWCPCKTVPLEVSANCEIVIEGLGGPVADDFGGAVRGSHGVLFAGGAVSGVQRHGDHAPENPASSDRSIVGKPPQEDFYLGKATERMFCRC